MCILVALLHISECAACNHMRTGTHEENEMGWSEPQKCPLMKEHVKVVKKKIKTSYDWHAYAGILKALKS